MAAPRTFLSRSRNKINFNIIQLTNSQGTHSPLTCHLSHNSVATKFVIDEPFHRRFDFVQFAGVHKISAQMQHKSVCWVFKNILLFHNTVVCKFRNSCVQNSIKTFPVHISHQALRVSHI